MNLFKQKAAAKFWTGELIDPEPVMGGPALKDPGSVLHAKKYRLIRQSTARRRMNKKIMSERPAFGDSLSNSAGRNGWIRKEL